MADCKASKAPTGGKIEISNGETIEKRWTIPKDGELRVEVGKSNSLQLILVSGDAEIFGSELVPDLKYTLKSGYCCSIHSWTGCVIISKSVPSENSELLPSECYSTSSTNDLIYLAQESPMLHYLNTHYYIKNLRDQASENDTIGPRVLVCGATDTGKSTLCQILLNYSIRNGNQCIYVDMDCGQNSLSIPGTISASYIDKQVTELIDSTYFQDSYSVTEKYSQISCPLVYFVGDASLDGCFDNYLHFSTLLGKNVLNKINSNKRLKRSGCIINTCGYIVGNGLTCIEHIIKVFKVNVILVIDNERLYTQLSQLNDVHSVLLPKSSGIVEKSSAYRKYKRNLAIKNYFYGIDGNFAPNIIKVSMDHFNIYSLSAFNILDSCLPLGFSGDNTSSSNQKIHARLIPPNDEMLNHLLAVVKAENEHELTESYILGFVVILKIDTTKRRVKFLSPGDLPSKYLIYTPSLVYDSASIKK